MSTEDLKAGWRRFVQESNKGKDAAMSVLDETCSIDYVYHSGSAGDIQGLKNVKQYFGGILSAFPDMHTTLDDVIVEGDKVAMRYTTTSTHKGSFMGIPPTNKKVTFWVIEIDRTAGGKFVEGWVRADTLNLMQQLGVVPMPKK